MPADMRNEEPMYLFGLCLRACYDNPLFTQDEERAGNDLANGTSLPVSQQQQQQQDGRVPVPVTSATTKDYLHALAPGMPQPVPAELRFGGQIRRRRWGCSVKVVCLSLFLVMLIGLVVGLIVHFLHARDLSSHSSHSPVISLSSRLQGSVTIAGGPFSVYKQDYEDVASAAFSLLLQAFQFKMDSVFAHSSYKEIYNSTDLVRVSSGSVVLHFVIHLRERRPLSNGDLREMTSLIKHGLRHSVFVVSHATLSFQSEFTAPMTTVIPQEHCEEVRVARCVNMTGYTRAAFPNLLGHPNQEVAERFFNQLGLSMLMACHHGYISAFLCGLFVPRCGPNSRPVPPCRSFCLEVYSRCNSTMPPGLSFPVDCDTLPDSQDPDVCMPSPYAPGKCVAIRRDELCPAEGFNSTAFPNLLGNQGEGEVVQLIFLIKGLEDATACYQHAMLFACSAFLSPCSGNDSVGHHNIPPCRSLCQAFRSRCEIFMDIFYAPWPKALACDRLPDSPDPQVCVGYKEAHQPPRLGECQAGDMRCDGHRCIQSSWVCDGYTDCQDNSDEAHCASCLDHETRCSPTSTLCINSSQACDGADHCYEGVDESDCVRIGEANDTRVLEARNSVSGQWEEVCSSGWNQTLALLTCKQLGYSVVLTNSLETPTKGRRKAVLGPLQPGAQPDRLQSYLSKGHVTCPDGDQYVVKLSCWEEVCGIRPANYESPLRVVGGEEVKPGTWPWLVSMHGGSDQSFFCGASLIRPDWVLTAGHCVGGGTRNTSYWTLVAGHTRRPAFSPYRQYRKPKRLILHPEFNHMTVNNDIALIQLEQPFVLSDYLRPVCLPEPGQAADIGTRCYVAGWGKVDSDAVTYQPAVREVNLDVVTWESCMAALQRSDIHVPYKLTNNMFCAGGAAGHDACQGDSGGPFMCRRPNTTDEWYQAGIVSWGIKCAIPNAPGIYTKLPLYVHWIHEVMRNNTDT